MTWLAINTFMRGEAAYWDFRARGRRYKQRAVHPEQPDVKARDEAEARAYAVMAQQRVLAGQPVIAKPPKVPTPALATGDELTATATTAFGASGAPAPSVPRTTQLGAMLRLWREVNNLSLRQVERLCGIDHCTLQRLEMGGQCDVATWLKLQKWLFSPACEEAL